MNKLFQYISLLSLGIFFGIALTKGEVVSWFRIQEMFRFQSFHMYGVIGTAVALGIILNQTIKARHIKSVEGKPILLQTKDLSIPRYLIGGTLFGLGWAMSGACPGPMYILLGNGFSVMLMVIFGAALGTLTYGMVRKYLPH